MKLHPHTILLVRCMNRPLDYFVFFGFLGDFNVAEYLFGIAQQCQKLIVCADGVMVIQKQSIYTGFLGD